MIQSKHLILSVLLACSLMPTVSAAGTTDISIPVSRSQLFEFKTDMGEVIVADPNIADVYAHGLRQLTIIGKSMGQTTVRVMGKDSKTLSVYNVSVDYDLPAIRKALKQFIPGENIGVELANKKVALTGKVSSTAVADRAMQVAEAFLTKTGGAAQGGASEASAGGDQGSQRNGAILNFMQIASSQQVMLHVRVGELQRTAIKRLGIDWANFGSPGNFFTQFATGTGTSRFTVDSEAAFTYDSTSYGQSIFGYDGSNTSFRAMLKVLERDGLFKLLAEPTLTAISGEEAEFLAGGEIPIPVPQPGGSSGGTTITLEYKPYGVAVKFRPYVLTENRIRIEVEPEVSELDSANAVRISNFSVPAITTRRAKTTVELAPGESFMIGGLIRDDVRAQVDQMPGIKEIPVLGALFRSTDFQHNESELVIAVTPYIVNPMGSGEVKLPTDNFTPPTQMDMLFYGNISGNKPAATTPPLEGPAGFMTE